MVTLAKYGHNYNMLVMEIDGTSTATKPTDKFEGMTIPNGSTYTEIDTNTKFMFDAENKVWYKTTVDSGGGYSKDEVDALLADKADLDSSGLVPTSQIPPEVFERMKVVEDDTARFVLTRADVQNGDVVYVNEDEVMYYVRDDTKLNSENGYQEFAAGIAGKAIADKDGLDISTTYQKKANAFTPTQAQLNAMNSGIDSTKVSQITTNTRNIADIQNTIGDINSVLEEVL